MSVDTPGVEAALDAVWHPHILKIIARFVSPNDVTCILRLVNRATAAQFRGYNIVKLSKPVPVSEFRRYWCAPGRMRSLTFVRRLELLMQTTKSGSLDNLGLAAEVAGLTLAAVGTKLVETAAAAGHVEGCVWLHERGCPWGACLSKAAAAGNWAVCEWLLEHDCPWSIHAAYKAAAGGHAALMEWLLQRRPDSNPVERAHHAEVLLEGVLRGCGLDTVQHLARDVEEVRTLVTRQQQAQLQQGQVQQQGQEQPEGLGSIEGGIFVAAAAGSPTPDWRAKVEWLEAQGWRGLGSQWPALRCADALDRLLWQRARGQAVRDDALWIVAARAGDVAGLQRLVDMGLSAASFDGCWYAAQDGHLAALQFLMKHGAQPTSFAALVAFAGGHLEVLRFLHARGVALTPQEVAEAVGDGEMNLADRHLPVLRWVVEALGVEAAAGCGLCEAAAELGSVETLAWLQQHGCPWDEQTLKSAVNGGSEEAIEWLLANGCPMQAHPRGYLPAARHGDLAILRCCLLRLGCPCDKRELLMACIRDEGCALPVLQWLVAEAGCPLDDCCVAARQAAAGRRWFAAARSKQVLEWLEEEGKNA